MKKFQKPVIEIITFAVEDIITTSSGEWCCDRNGRPGHGYGDNNHDHYGPPGQNKKP